MSQPGPAWSTRPALTSLHRAQRRPSLPAPASASLRPGGGLRVPVTGRLRPGPGGGKGVLKTVAKHKQAVVWNTQFHARPACLVLARRRPVVWKGN